MDMDQSSLMPALLDDATPHLCFVADAFLQFARAIRGDFNSRSA